MERMTFKGPDGQWCIDGSNGKLTGDRMGRFYGPAIDALAAFEDSGIDPKDLRCNVDIDFPGVVNLLKAKAEGRAIIIPCPLGTTLYRICRINRKNSWRNKVEYVKPVVFNENNFWRIVFGGEFGKTVFLKKDEANAALAKRKAGVK